MIFTSFTFLLFFTVVTILYWLVTHTYRWIVLLAASFLFYTMAVPAYLPVLIGAIALNYFFGRWIGRTNDRRKKFKILTTGILVNILLLAIFKYFTPITGFGLIVPLGISFFTFANISYLIEVKRKKIPAEDHFGYFACSVSFFPKLIQGPIERSQNFIPQLHEKHIFNYTRVVYGMRLMLWGYAKKLIIADRLAVIVDAVYAVPGQFSGGSLVSATLLYAFQIYFDFSGYIDIARGAATILGFDLSPNFNIPYMSRSVKEFWSRWHMTLSGWLRDYIFLPLAWFLSGRMKKESYAGIRTERLVYAMAITVTFLLCGVWHGTGWNFLAWGGLFAVYLMAGHFTEKPRTRFYKKIGILHRKWIYDPFQMMITFILVCFGWVFFRSPDLSTSIKIISGFFRSWNGFLSSSELKLINTPDDIPDLSFTATGIIFILVPFMMVAEYLFSNRNLMKKFNDSPAVIRWSIYYILVFMIIYFAKYEPATFIYSKF